MAFQLPASVPDEGKAFLKISYENAADDRILLPRGHIFGFDEIMLDTGNNQSRKVKMVNDAFGKTNKKLRVFRPILL